MSAFKPTSFLRRTLALLSAVSALAIAGSAQAQLTLKDPQGRSCPSMSLSISPDGTVTLQCAGSTNNPPAVDNTVPGTFSMALPTTEGTANTSVPIVVNRTGGGLAMTLWYWFSGAGCQSATVGGVSFGTGQMSATITAALTSAGTTCTVVLGEPAAPGALGANTFTDIFVRAGTVSGNCPAQPAGMIEATLEPISRYIQQAASSGQVVSLRVPANGLNSMQVAFSESPAVATPDPVRLEISVNKCPGLIDTNQQNACNWVSTNGHMVNSVTFLMREYGALNATNTGGYCWAGDANTQYYINARWTYDRCGQGAQICGFLIGTSYGPY